MLAYCGKCKAHRAIKNPTKVTLNGKTVTRGVCPVCGSKLFSKPPKDYKGPKTVPGSFEMGKRR